MAVMVASPHQVSLRRLISGTVETGTEGPSAPLATPACTLLSPVEPHRTPGGMTLWACLPSQSHLPTLGIPSLNWAYLKPLQRWWITWACLSRPQPRHSFLRGTFLFSDAPWPSWSLPLWVSWLCAFLSIAQTKKFPFTGMDFRKLKLFFSTKLWAP